MRTAAKFTKFNGTPEAGAIFFQKKICPYCLETAILYNSEK